MSVLRRLAKKSALAAAEWALTRGVEGLSRVPSEHRQQAEKALEATKNAAQESRAALDRGECGNAYEHASASRAFATLTAAEGINAGGGVKMRDVTRKALTSASRAHAAVTHACAVVSRNELTRGARRELEPAKRELPAHVEGIRRGKRAKR